MFEVDIEFIAVDEDGNHVFKVTWGTGSRMVVVSPEDVEEGEPEWEDI